MLRGVKRGPSSRKNEMKVLLDRLHQPQISLQELADIESEIMMHYIQLPGAKGLAQRIEDYFRPDGRSNQEQIDTLRMATGEPLSQIYYVSKELKNEIWEFAQECKTNRLRFLTDPSKKDELKRMEEILEFNRELTEGTINPASQVAKSQKVTDKYKDKLLGMIFSNEEKVKVEVQADRDLRIKLARVANIYQPKNAARSLAADLIFDTRKTNPSNLQRNEDTQKQLRLKILTNLRKQLLKRRAEIVRKMMDPDDEPAHKVESTERTHPLPNSSSRNTHSNTRNEHTAGLSRGRSFQETSRDRQNLSHSLVSARKPVKSTTATPQNPLSQALPPKPSAIQTNPQPSSPGVKALPSHPPPSKSPPGIARIFQNSFDTHKTPSVLKSRLQDSDVIFEDSDISGIEH